MEESQSKTPKKPRSWLRRLLWTLGILLLLVVVFHRFIIFGLVKIGVGYAEKSAHLQIAYQLEGTIFTTLILSDVRVRAIEPGPLEKLTLKRLALHYHPWDAFRQGLPALIESIELRDLDLSIDGTFPSTPKPPKPKKKSSGISIPFPKLVDLRGITVTVKTATEPLEIKNASLTLLPDKPGVLAADKLAIPNWRTLENIHGDTTYINRDLILQNLTIEKNLVIDTLQIDASQIGNNKLAAQLAAQTFGGKLNVGFSLSDMSDTPFLTLSLDAQKIDLAQLTAFTAPPVDPSITPIPPITPNSLGIHGLIDSLNLNIEGQAADLSTWNGYVQLVTSNLTFGANSLDRGSLHATLTNGQVKITDTVFSKREQKVSLTGTAQLPGKNPQKSPFLADVNLVASLPDLSVLFPDVSGGASFSAAIKASPTKISAVLKGDVTSLGMNDLNVDAANVTASFIKSNPKVIDWKQPWWTNTNINADVNTGTIFVSGYQIDKVGAKITSKNEKLTIQDLEILRGKNSIRSSGGFTFQEKPVGPFPGALAMQLKIDAPVLHEFSINNDEPIIEGSAQGTADLNWSDKNPVADLHLQASDLVHQGVKLGTLDLAAHVENGLAKLINLHLDMPGKSFVQATGEFDLDSMDRYAAQVSTRITDLSQFKPLLEKSAADTPLAGTFQLDWNGTGHLKDKLNEGRLALYLKDGVYADLTGINLRTSGFYTPKHAEFPELTLTSSKGDFGATIDYADQVLKISNIKLTQGGNVRLAGSIAVPLDIENISNSEKRFPLDEPVQIDLAGKDVVIGEMLTGLGMVPPATGILNLDIKAKGTLRNLDAAISLKAANLEIAAAKELQPIAAEINLAIGNQRAQLFGSIREPSIQPISLSGSLPLDLASIISTGTVSKELPLSANVTLPPSDLAFVSRYVGVMERIQGKAGLDVTVEGTLAKPRFLGNVKANINSIRFRGDSIPDVRNMDVALAFRDNVLNIDQFKADLAGGLFNASGKLNLTKPAEPIFDVNLKGRSILVTRNDNMIVRTDLDIDLKGPMATAEVAGKIGIVDSRFFRDIDILPLNLPGRPAPPIQSKTPDISITAPPVRDWKFNVSIKTIDDFKITGNLANGNVIVNLNLGGTGLAPTLDGFVRVSKLDASLPFSKLNITDGNIYFSKDQPLLSGTLDLVGKSQVRDYDITAYIYGDLTKPQTLFVSQPPLSQEDILTLLGTGVTQSEIQQNPQLLAGRAGFLFVQKLYGKIFKKKRGVDDDNAFVDRFDLQIGNVDPKTGRENVSARFKVTDKWRIIFDLDLTGGVRGQVRYLLRFK